jgi:hypothetical protein
MVVRTKMSEAPASSRKYNPVAWLCLAVLQRAVYSDTLYTWLSIFAVPTNQQLIRTAQRKDAASLLSRFSGIGVT